MSDKPCASLHLSDGFQINDTFEWTLKSNRKCASMYLQVIVPFLQWKQANVHAGTRPEEAAAGFFWHRVHSGKSQVVFAVDGDVHSLSLARCFGSKIRCEATEEEPRCYRSIYWHCCPMWASWRFPVQFEGVILTVKVLYPAHFFPQWYLFLNKYHLLRAKNFLCVFVFSFCIKPSKPLLHK